MNVAGAFKKQIAVSAQGAAFSLDGTMVQVQNTVEPNRVGEQRHPCIGCHVLAHL